MTEQKVQFDEIRALVKATPEADLEARLHEWPGGIDAALDLVFDTLAQNFKPEAAGAEEGIFQYVVKTTDGERPYEVVVKDKTCTVGKGRAAEPNVEIGISATDFVRMSTGDLSGGDAFMTGKMQMSGDLFFAMKLQDWFEAP